MKSLFIALICPLVFCLVLSGAADANSPVGQEAGWLVEARRLYAGQDYRAAIKVLKRAAKSLPDCPQLHYWLGRSYGREAERAVWVRAVGLAKKTRRHFEKAVSLDPAYEAAWADLFEYYLRAPVFLGGGRDRAIVAAQHLLALNAELGEQAYIKLGQRFETEK